MLLSLDTGVSALEQFQQQINVIANNIANVNTTAFKQGDVNFEDTLSNTVGSNAAGSIQVGTGVTTASILNDFSSQGTLKATNIPSDLAVDGSGFFVVKDPVSGNSFVTQDGSFGLDNNGYLVTSNGLRLQGSTGDIQISAGAGGTATVASYTIGKDGTVNVTLSDGSSSSAGQITLQNYANPDQLVRVGNNQYSAPTAAGGLAAAVAPGSSGTGLIRSGYLEMSNVDLAAQLTSLISAQRAYEANSKTISTSDSIMQTLVNLKQG